MTLSDLSAAVAATADPILARELARLTAPPPPPEPSPSSLATRELIARLPGRHDLIAAAAGRLCEETRDHGAATWGFYRKAVGAVAARSVAPDVLADCLGQATSPRSLHPGKVFVTSWKRATGTPF